LPIVENGELVGIVTTHDLLTVMFEISSDMKHDY